jgi:hypothetical protein
VDFAKAGHRDWVVQYPPTVSGAFPGAEDALVALQVCCGHAKSQATAVADSQRALDVALNRYAGGSYPHGHRRGEPAFPGRSIYLTVA